MAVNSPLTTLHLVSSRCVVMWGPLVILSGISTTFAKYERSCFWDHQQLPWNGLP